MSDKTSFYITTAISYPNGRPHIGHAYELITTDAIARFQRLDGRDVFFLTGTDEHGQKMQQTARALNIAPEELAQHNSEQFRTMGRLLDASNDDFIRTTEERHHQASRTLWRLMQQSGDLYKDSYTGWYSVRDEAYYAEDETEKRPDGLRYGPQGTPVEWVEEESYFFRLSQYQDRLLMLYEENPDFIGPPERRNEMISFVKFGLKDLSVSRTTFDWGIKVPDDSAHVMYVWIDALTNYLTATGYLEHFQEKWEPVFRPEMRQNALEDKAGPRARYWPADLHIIGKDIIRFHAVYWPAFLMSAGLPLPHRVFAHGFVLNNGEKMSKSLGNVVDPFEIVEKFGIDYVRYFLCREISLGQDGNCNEALIATRVNADLANGIGNLASRSLSMIVKSYGGRIPAPGPFTKEDAEMLAAADRLLAVCRTEMNRQLIHRALTAIIAVVSQADRYFASQEPWALKKTDPERMSTVLYVTAEVVRQIAILLQPFMPSACEKLLNLAGTAAGARDFTHLGKAGRLTPGTLLNAPAPVFPRYVVPEA